jgi:hypothetical protein
LRTDGTSATQKLFDDLHVFYFRIGILQRQQVNALWKFAHIHCIGATGQFTRVHHLPIRIKQNAGDRLTIGVGNVDI